jgi:hypothetical protein
MVSKFVTVHGAVAEVVKTFGKHPIGGETLDEFRYFSPLTSQLEAYPT